MPGIGDLDWGGLSLGAAALGLPQPIPAREAPTAPKRTPGPYLVNFYALDGSADLTVMMGNGPAQLTGGDGGWVEEPRRGLAPTLWWDSPSSYRQSIPIRFSGASEQAINSLFVLARTPGSRRPPPLVAIAGPAIHRADLLWVVDKIDPGSNVERRPDDGDRTRQDYTVNLINFNGVDVLVERSPSRKVANQDTTTSPSRTRTTYRVREGDTLPKIAARQDVYGDWRQWKKIANANPVNGVGRRDPRSLKIGETLKIPR
jgi:LysM repeat protein